MPVVRLPPVMRHGTDLPYKRGIGIGQAILRFWWLRFGPASPVGIRRRRVEGDADPSLALGPAPGPIRMARFIGFLIQINAQLADRR